MGGKEKEMKNEHLPKYSFKSEKMRVREREKEREMRHISEHSEEC